MTLNQQLIDQSALTAQSGQQLADQAAGQRDRQAKPVLRICNLSKSFGGLHILKDVTADLYAGEIVLLHGLNGSGKTTLLNCLTGNLEPDSGFIEIATSSGDHERHHERFRFPRKWWQGINPLDRFSPEKLANAGLGRTWQAARLFKSLTLAENLALATPGQRGENPCHAVFRAASVRHQTGINMKAATETLAKLSLAPNVNAALISLGQSKRATIARALKAGSRILFLDEPLAGLDSKGISEVMTLLSEVVQEHKATLVIIEHAYNIPQILPLCDRAWRLESGELFVESKEELERQVMAENEITRSFMDWLKGQSVDTSRQELPGGARLTVATIKESSQNVVQLSNIAGKRDERIVPVHLDDGFSLSLKRGQIAVLEAPNGWGKSSLIETIAGLLPLASGNITLQDREIGSKRPWERANLGLAILHSREQTFNRLTVKEALALSARRIPQEIEHLSKRCVSSLSGGERRDMLLKSFLGRDKFVVGLLDEPFLALDARKIRLLAETLISRSDAALIIALPRAT